MTDQSVLVRQKGGVCRITLNRPEVLNAYNGAVATALLNALSAVAGDRKVRVVVLQTPEHKEAVRAFLAMKARKERLKEKGKRTKENQGRLD